MPALQKCPGCLNQFTSLNAHLAQTSNPLCQRLTKKYRPASSGPVRRRSPRPLRPHLPAPRHFSPQTSPTFTTPILVPPGPISPSPGSPVTSDTDSSDEEADFLTSETTPGWEPPVTPGPEIGSDPPSDMEPDNPLTPVPPDDIRQRTWAPPRVVRFPGTRAGEPIGSTSPSHNVYGASLGNPSRSNPYAPFASKVDWDVAEWAKLHGPSSTSFANLLKIDGV